jgi:hypothetical protein
MPVTEIDISSFVDAPIRQTRYVDKIEDKINSMKQKLAKLEQEN